MTRDELRDYWSERRTVLHRLNGSVDGAKIIDDFLAGLADLTQSEDDAVLTLSQAAARSGYSAEHLGRLVRTGQIPNAGRPRAPRIRVRDIPRKSTPTLTRRRPTGYDVNADARALRGGRQ